VKNRPNPFPRLPRTPRALAAIRSFFPGLVLALVAGFLLSATGPATARGEIKPRTVEKLGTSETIKSQKQRQLADELARRHLGTPLTGGEIRDLETLQRR